MHLIYNTRSDYDNPVRMFFPACTHLISMFFFVCVQVYNIVCYCFFPSLRSLPPHNSYENSFLGDFQERNANTHHNIINILTKQKQNQQETRGKASGIYGNGKLSTRTHKYTLCETFKYARTHARKTYK